MPLRLTLRQPLPARCKMPDLLPHLLINKSMSEIERIPVWFNATHASLAELFRVSGSIEADERLEIEGDLSFADELGAGLTRGSIHVQGSVGCAAAKQISGGKIEIVGNSGDWLAAEMSGGHVQLHGSTGDFAAACQPSGGGRLQGGCLIVQGSAGCYLGRGMRRGVIAIAGSAGDCVGQNMLAGTILVFGKQGQHAGFGMKRGTIALLSKDAPSPGPTFQQGSLSEPRFMRLLGVWLAANGFSQGISLLGMPLRQYHGDMAFSHRGELFYRVTP